MKFGKLIWKVIAVENENKLLLSKDCMSKDFDWEFGQENSKERKTNNQMTPQDILNDMDNTPIDYEEEFLNTIKYLNGWFCDKYFSNEELERIVSRSNDNGERYASAKIQDIKVFLMSEDEVERFLPVIKNRIARMHVMFNDVARAWTLSYDSKTGSQRVVNTEGEIETVPNGQINEWFRPAVWVK